MKKLLTDYMYSKILGENGLEAYYLDTFLELFKDGMPHSELPHAKNEAVWIQLRIDEKLTKDGFLNRWGRNGYIITSEGRLHLEKGGYRKQLLYQKLTPFTFWFSLISTILSIIAFFRSL